jgi:AsmA family protein
MKALIKISIGITLLILIGIGIFISTFDVNQYKGQIIKAVQNNTNRSFSIDGDLRIGYSLIPTIVVEGVKFGNAKWGSNPEMLNVGSFEAQIALLPLLDRDIEVKELKLNDATILIETNKEGVGNWVFDKKSKPTEAKKTETGTEELPVLNIDQINIHNAKLTYKNAADGTTHQLNLADFTIQHADSGKALDVDLDATYDNIPILIKGKTGLIKNLLDNKDFPVEVQVKVKDIEAELKGIVSDIKKDMVLDMAVTVDMKSLKTVNELANQKLPEVGPLNLSTNLSAKNGIYTIKDLKANLDKISLNADGKITDPKNAKGVTLKVKLEVPTLSDLNSLAGSELPALGPLSLMSDVTNADGSYQLKGIKLKFANSDLSGDASINISGERPALTATLNSNVIDLIPFMPEEKEKEKKDRLFPSDPLPLDPLKSVDANLTLNAAKIKTKDHDLDKVAIGLNLSNGNLAISKLDAGILGGRLSSNMKLNNKGKSADLDLSLAITGITLDKLPDLKDKVSGAPTDINLSIKGSGQSVSSIMGGSNGKLLVQTGKGNLSSSALDAASADLLVKTLSMLSPNAERQSSSLECAVVNFDIKDGIATADKGIALSTTRMNVMGSGTVNLKTEELDIGITPKARQGVGLSLGKLAVFIRLGGTLANPKPKTDTNVALQSGLAAGAAVATGGLSLLAQGLMDTKDSGSIDNPCDVALGKAPKQTQAATDKPVEEKSAVDKSTNAVKEATGAIGDKLKGLFGK